MGRRWLCRSTHAPHGHVKWFTSVVLACSTTLACTQNANCKRVRDDVANCGGLSWSTSAYVRSLCDAMDEYNRELVTTGNPLSVVGTKPGGAVVTCKYTSVAKTDLSSVSQTEAEFISSIIVLSRDGIVFDGYNHDMSFRSISAIGDTLTLDARCPRVKNISRHQTLRCC